MYIGNYSVEIKHYLLQGSFGIAFKGFEKRTNKPVTVKQLHDVEHLGKGAFQEVDKLHQINHEHLVEVLFSKEDGNCWWTVLEYCDLGDLERFLKSRHLEMRQKLLVMYQSASAVSYLHNMKSPVIHGDIKPANILVNTVSQGFVIKVCDMGLADILKANQEITETDFKTLSFRAPEYFSAANKKMEFTVAADTFSLGLVYKVVIDYGEEGKHMQPTAGNVV